MEMNTETAEVFKEISTNGRWGVVVLGPKGTEFPARGSLRHIGAVSGVETFVFTPSEEIDRWVYPVDREVKVHGGASVVYETGLQSGRHASVLVMGEKAVVEFFGYSRRSSRVYMYVDGVDSKCPPTILLAAGLLEPDEKEVEVPPPPPLEGAMAAAFAALK